MDSLPFGFGAGGRSNEDGAIYLQVAESWLILHPSSCLIEKGHEKRKEVRNTWGFNECFSFLGRLRNGRTGYMGPGCFGVYDRLLCGVIHCLMGRGRGWILSDWAFTSGCFRRIMIPLFQRRGGGLSTLLLAFMIGMVPFHTWGNFAWLFFFVFRRGWGEGGLRECTVLDRVYMFFFTSILFQN